ncbi:MAG TPA: hypothetical protein VFI46_07670 [Jiangellaceae bacterium]|nr:hypothetical protein [Jiangellaceae bacterium]
MCRRRARYGKCGRGASTIPRYLALLRVDVEALHRGQVAGEELCEITGVGPIPVSVARGLLGTRARSTFGPRPTFRRRSVQRQPPAARGCPAIWWRPVTQPGLAHPPRRAIGWRSTNRSTGPKA